jgi:hypothetical protein
VQHFVPGLKLRPEGDPEQIDPRLRFGATQPADNAPVFVASEERESAFTSNRNFLVSLLLDSHQAEDIINHLQEVYERDIKRYGQTKAKLLYGKNVLVSLWPVAKWVSWRRRRGHSQAPLPSNRDHNAPIPLNYT